ncbi:TonB-dependent receptor plug domain-containing protein [Duganella sp. P38]|uniref:TonB-dependent receptor plug domain-containing protein n=1 Tax=Duganella sp. P38 TaxID=3423949 RepID=UPI003D7A46A1
MSTLKKSALALALALAYSEFAAAQEEAIQRVEVTGSSIKRTAAESAGSVQVLTRDDIERTGETTALGILTTTSAISTQLNAATQGAATFANGSSGVSMRGLGKVSTLVLVNGRRIAQYALADSAQQNFTNIDAIPAAAIERIEILKDGASAIYGSDAIAGVVNIILRKNFNGAKISANYREADGFRDLRTRNVTGIVGFGDLDKDGYNTYVNYEFYKNDGYTTGELASHYPDWHRLTPGRSTWDARSQYSPTGNYFLSSTNIVAAPGCPADAIDPADKQCKYDALATDGATTGSRRWALASNTHFRIGKEIDANFELTAAGATTDYLLSGFTTNTTTSAAYWYDMLGGNLKGPFYYPKLPVGHANNPYSVPVEYRARLTDTGDGFNFNTTQSQQYRAMLSLNGEIGGWDWKSAVGHMKSSADKDFRGTSATGYTNAIVSGAYKFGQQNDPALLESMFPVRNTYGKARISFVDATVSGEVAQLPAGPLRIAVGTDIRRESYEMKSSDNVLRGELVSAFGLQVKDTVDHYALFTEATIPVLKRVELTAAVRGDKTSNSDAHFSPKVGLRVNATDTLLLRATGSGGFRAPNIVESGNGLGRGSYSTGVQDYRRCPIATALNALVQNAVGATTGDKALANSYRGTDCSAVLPAFVSSNPDLKPETSRTLTAGFVWEPVKNWTMAIDYYHIERKDQIGTRTLADILQGEASLPAGQLVRVDNSASDAEFLALVQKYAPGNTLNFGGLGKVALVYNPYVNSGKTRTSGFDFDASGRFNTALGQVRLKLEGAYTWKYQEYSVTNGAYGANQAGNWDGGPRLNTKLRAALKTGDFDHGATINYTSGYSNNSVSSPTYCATNSVASAYLDTCNHVGSNTTVDYNLAWSGIPHTKLSLFINNLFEQDAPVQWRSGYSPQFRRIGVTAAYTF